jgi:hypothetical protein
LRSEAPAGAAPSGGKDATCVFAGAVGNCDGSVVPGEAGGGSWLELTWPAGAAGSGAGCWSSIDEKRVVEQPLATSAASDTATRPLFEKFIPTSVGSGWGMPSAQSHLHQDGEGGEISTRYG